MGITSGPDGRLWFAERNVAKIGRLTVAPATGAVTRSDVTVDSASVAGTVTPNSEATTYRFEWGTTTDYGQSTPAASAGAAATPQAVSAALAGLAPSTTYHVRLVATNAAGSSAGPDLVFVTAAAPEPPVAPVTPQPEPQPQPEPVAPAPAPAPPEPAFGRTAVASVTQGTVSFRIPGSTRPVTVGGDAAIPTGSIIDTRNGTIALESALDARGRTQTARLHGATFRMSLSRKSGGMVDLTLTQRPTGCPPRRSARAALALRATRKARRPIKLWGSDRNGRYRTNGRNSVAVVRGTEWSTTETCAGTLTRVMAGAVSVRDRHTGKTVLVRAKRSYLARPRA